MNRPAKVRGRYRKDDDEAMAVLIRRLVDERPSYGYRRITALVNRRRRRQAQDQRQVSAADHAGQPSDAGTPYRPPARPNT
jgi:hypothetical protein